MEERKRSLPEVFESSNGRRVKSVEDWRNFRRPEIIELYREYVYGREPVGRPDSLRFHVVLETPVMQGTVIHKQIDINFTGQGGEGRIRLQLYIPITESQVPTFIYAAIKGQRVSEVELEECSAYWPVEDIVSRGYAAVSYHVEDLDPDFYDESYRNGVHGVFDSPSESRSPDAWGAMSAWAWGASRVMDYLETDSRIDSERVAIVGFSRSGKACLWAGALDERFALVVSNDSGCSGAAISRGKAGERLININRGNPHWFNDNYKKFNEREEELPIDQHLLLSLIAPRPLYVASASEDNWADPKSEFLGLLLAQSVYMLYGFNALDAHHMPPVNSPVCSDRVGYHLREGKHDITRYDWMCFMDFADRRL